METFFQKDLWVENRNKVIAKENALFEEAKKNPGNRKYLHLGCGPRILEGFVNVDKYYQDERVINYDIYQLPYAEESIDFIYCSHVLEHLPIRHAQMAINEWSRVMRDGGYLALAIPDIEIIMHRLLDPDISEPMREWLLYTLFGFQTNPDNRGTDLDYPVDPGQFHTCGFTKDMITKKLENAGFVVEKVFRYDGWGTPSLWIDAHRKIK